MIADLVASSLSARLPVVAMTTKDVVYLDRILKELTGQKANLYKNGETIKADSFYYFRGDKAELMTMEETYRKFSRKNSMLILINYEEVPPWVCNLGEVYAPKEVIYDVLSEPPASLSEKKAKIIIPYLGGLFLKECVELVKMAKVSGGINPKTIISLKHIYGERSKGLEIVPTDLKGFSPCNEIESIRVNEERFFIEDYDSRLRPKGLMAVGIPGTGKTLSAKYLASEWQVPLFKMDASIQSKYVGESEHQLLAALKEVEENAPAILLIDEIEKFFTKTSDSGVTQKLLGVLLWWLQEHDSKVFTYMTCNNEKSIPPELFRKGRIDFKVTFGNLTNNSEKLKLCNTIVSSYRNVPKKVKRCIVDRIESEKGLTAAEIADIVKTEIKNHIIKKGA